jgi:hypothetical protein
MRNGILRDVIFACAGLLLVMAAIGLPRQDAAARPQWSEQWQSQDIHFLPFYSFNEQHRAPTPGGRPPAPPTP